MQYQRLNNLFDTILSLSTTSECAAFFKDLCTPAELNAMADRWHVAKILAQGQQSYREIHHATGVSLVTISRIARFLKQEEHQGYKTVLTRLKDGATETQTPPSSV